VCVTIVPIAFDWNIHDFLFCFGPVLSTGIRVPILEHRIVNSDKGICKNGDVHESHGESDRRESRSSGMAVEFNRRDDTKVGGSIGEKISYDEHARNRREQRR